jgi:signal transduction histidine kinase
LRYLSAAAALYALVGGAVSFAGWITGIYRLADWRGNGITIKANTALTIAIAGVALLLVIFRPSARRLIRAIGFFVAIVGALTLLEHVTQWSLGIDTLLFDEPTGTAATAAPGRMGPPAALSLLLLGTALLLTTYSSRSRGFSVGLSLVATGIGMLSLTGYLYGAEVMYAIPRLSGIAVQTASMITVLGVGLVAALPDHHPMRMLREDSSAGVLARRVFPFVFLVPLLFGWVRMLGQKAGLYDAAFGTAMRSIMEIVILAGLLWWRLAALRDADRRKDEFLATLAHELRNPLAPIGNAAKFLLRQNLPDATAQRSAEIIDRQVRHMARLLDDLLDVSRISRNSLQLRKERVELEAVIHSALEASRPIIESAQHDLTVVLPKRPIYLDGDPVRLAQVFANLLNNAAKYTEPGGRIGIAGNRQGADAVIRVWDNGIGIAPEMLPLIFEIFAQAKPALERSQGGLGIGLSLARGVVELHGGRIEAHSSGPGKGSEFVVRLPTVS